VIGGLLTSVVLGGAIFASCKWRVEIFDKTTLIALSIGVIGLWFVPWGVLILAPLALLISVLSPAGRLEWKTFRKRRIITAFMLLLILNSSGFYPVNTPVGAPEWGEPIATENPHAPAWPASEQYTWIHEGAVIGVLVTRTPHTFSTFGQASSTMSLGVMMGMHDERLHQSIQLMDDSIPGFSINADAFSLAEVSTEGSHNYGDEELTIARFDVKREGFETTLARVLVVGFPTSGGELTLLTITRPILSSQPDVFEEKIVLQFRAP